MNKQSITIVAVTLIVVLALFGTIAGAKWNSVMETKTATASNYYDRDAVTGFMLSVHQKHLDMENELEAYNKASLNLRQ